MSESPDAAAPRKDWARQPSTALFWWGLPLAIGLSAHFLRFSFRAGAGVCAVALAWMAAGCLLNARRCRRVHCYIAGPVLLSGAIFAALAAAGIIAPGPRTFANAVSAILLLALLSFVPEMLWKRYA
ncbi:MAG TPA: hypothetical protein VII49_08135 [Rhizomicrobium sp.]